jgi:hypothetical protein
MIPPFPPTCEQRSLAIAKPAPIARQPARAKVRPVIAAPTTPRLGFTVTETPRPPVPVEPDPFIGTPPPPPGTPPVVR